MYEIFEKLCELHNTKPFRVAQATGISTATITSWKQGKYTPKQDKLQKIADYFDVPLEYLLTGEMPEHHYISDDAREMAQFMFDNPEYKILFDASRKVRKEDIEMVKAILDKFKEAEE